MGNSTVYVDSYSAISGVCIHTVGGNYMSYKDMMNLKSTEESQMRSRLYRRWLSWREEMESIRRDTAQQFEDEKFYLELRAVYVKKYGEAGIWWGE